MTREHWSPGARLARRALAAPAPLIDRVAGPPRAVDGRVLDRSAQALLAIGERVAPDRSTTDVAAMRTQMRQVAPLGLPVRTDVITADRILAGPGGALEVRSYRPAYTADPPPVWVYAHGGGWVTGDLDTHDATCRLLAAEGRCAVVSVHYRRAPEHPFPAAIDDVLAAYGWVHDRADELDVDRGRVGLMGDSAGGNLAAVVSLLARDLDVPSAAAQCLVYPAVDLTMSSASHRSMSEGFGLDHAAMVRYRTMYLPDDVEWTDPRVSPWFAPDLSGLPPALIVTAGFDPLRDDGAMYADALRKVDVPVRYRCYDDQIHGFFGMGVLPGGMVRVREVCRLAGDLLHGGATWAT